MLFLLVPCPSRSGHGDQGPSACRTSPACLGQSTQLPETRSPVCPVWSGKDNSSKRFRSVSLSTFSPLLGNKQGEGNLVTRQLYSCKDDTSCDFRFLHSLERKWNILAGKKACLGTEEESGNCFHIRVFLLSLFPPFQFQPSGHQLHLLL